MTTKAHAILLNPVTSKALAAYGYEDDVVAIQFPSGHIHHYRGVPSNVLAAFEEAPSKGSFFAHEIKGQFPGEKVTGYCGKCGDIGLLGHDCDDCGTDTYQEQA